MIKEIVGGRIRQLRIEQKLSQEKLALKAGIDRTYLASVEAGRRNISIVNLEKLILALETTFERFFQGI